MFVSLKFIDRVSISVARRHRSETTNFKKSLLKKAFQQKLFEKNLQALRTNCLVSSFNFLASLLDASQSSLSYTDAS